jgi:hypothetical protein
MTGNAIAHRAFHALIASIAVCSGASAFAVDFQTRCADTHVIQCVDFDTPATIAGGYGDVSGSFANGAGTAAPEIDTTIKASGTGSLKLTVPPNSAADTSGSFFTNFSRDKSVLFGENSEFYVQWRQRFSPEFLAGPYAGGGGWKQLIIGTGDYPGSPFFTSCSDLETVVQNIYHRGFAQMYNSCSGSTSHGPYTPFEQSYGSTDIKLQNARPSPYCLYSQGQTKPVTYFPPTGNCMGYFANEWMTFQVAITTGPRVNDEFVNSRIRLWIARAGQPSQIVFDFSPFNLTAGAPADNERFGKVWLLAYNTGKDSTVTYPTAYIWYDELIISTARIADPDANSTTPNPPSNVTAQ